MAVFLDLLRLFAGASVLAFAAWTDWQWRRAPNVLWLLLAGVGAACLAAEAALDPSAFVARWPYLAFVPAFAGLMYVFWYFGLIAGGADAKALMAIAVLLPFPVAWSSGLPFLQTPLPGAFSVLGNSLLAFLLIPLAFFVWNFAHGDFRLPHALLGLKREAGRLRVGHFWPMEVVAEDGARRTRLFASRMSAGEVEETFERLHALGAERVWVSPKVPFMVPLLVGFVAAFVAGDLMFGLLQAVLPRP